jgi:hypothetical protein
LRLEELGQLKNPMTSGFEAVTFPPVAQCLNQLRYRVHSEEIITAVVVAIVEYWYGNILKQRM